MNTGFEGLAVIIGLATILAYAAKKTQQPTVIAYIATGLILGPVGFSLLGETELTQLFSELGLVFLLFFIGLEIDISEIQEVLKPTVIIGISQMALTALLGGLTGLVLGFSLVESAFLGAAAMFSSTALVVKMLTDKDEATTLPGRLDVGVLLIQDIVVVLILAILTASFTSIPALALRFGEIIFMIALIGGVSLASSRYLLPKIFMKVSRDQQTFFVYGIAWAFILISGAQYLELSLEIGAFFAGLSLAQLPYSSELQERVRPLTDLFMAVFFVNFGLKILPEQLSAYFFEAIIASGILMLGKFVIFFGLVDRMKFTPETSFKTSINMTQISEFSLILGALAVTEGFIGNNFLGFISLIAIITMSLSSYLLNFNHEIFQRTNFLLSRLEGEDRQDVEVHNLEGHAVVIGHNLITERILPLIKQHYGEVVIIDKNPENTGELSKSQYEYIYGDFKHGEIRKASKLKDADLVISFAQDRKVSHQILRDKRRDTTAFLEASNFEEAAELYERGAEYVMIENIVSADKMSDYLELYIEDPEIFREEIQDDLETIHWGGREDG
ncbi:MAG: Kef-type K+ transport system membrane component KefB [Candidatus Nanohaloarchaea archaeon]|jgi:Kef-type K+ transport system membrane component KefB